MRYSLTGLGIAGLTKADGVTVYPNPVADQLYIGNQHDAFNQVTVITSLGQVVKKEPLKKGTNKVDVSHIASGMYYLVLNGNKGARSVKIHIR